MRGFVSQKKKKKKHVTSFFLIILDYQVKVKNTNRFLFSVDRIWIYIVNLTTGDPPNELSRT